MQTFKLDPENKKPLHSQVETLLRQLIQKTQYKAGELLPPEASMAKQLDISRSTVRAAISRLVQEGLLERKAGLGTRVIKPSLKTSLKNWPSFSNEMQRKGIEIEIFSLSVSKSPTPSEILSQMNLPTDHPNLLKMERTRGFSGSPAVHSISWFTDATKLSIQDNFSQPLYDLIQQKSGLTPKTSQETISACIASPTLADILQCAVGDPLLQRTRNVLDDSAKVFEHNINYYRADLYKYELSIDR